MTPEPIGLAGGINLFVYAGLNPINAIDPYGLDLILVGDGGKLGGMLTLAAKTWERENKGNHQIVPVSSGLAAIQAMKDYAQKNNGIDGLQVFSHGGTNGLYFDQSSGYASLYSHGLGWWYAFIKSDAVRIGQIDPSWFKEDAQVTLNACNTAKGDSSFAEQLAKHLNRSVTGSQSGMQFSGVKNGRPNQGLPKIVPGNHYPIYMVPEGAGNRTFTGR